MQYYTYFCVYKMRWTLNANSIYEKEKRTMATIQ